MPAPALTILYDGTCNLCLASRRRLERWKTAPSMRFVALQDSEACALVPGLSPEEYLGAMHVVEEGKVRSGADAWFRIMRLAPAWYRWVAWVTPRFVARPVYRWIARNRYKWFGRADACGSGSCALHRPTASGGTPSSKPSGSRGPASPAP